MNVVLVTPKGVLSRLSDDNYLYRNGKISFEQIVERAEASRTRWLATCGYMISDIEITWQEGSSGEHYRPIGKRDLEVSTSPFEKSRKRKKKAVDKSLKGA